MKIYLGVEKGFSSLHGDRFSLLGLELWRQVLARHVVRLPDLNKTAARLHTEGMLQFPDWEKGKHVPSGSRKRLARGLWSLTVITELKGKGLSLAKIAGGLNKRKVATPRGGKWDHSSVGNVLQRLAA